MLSPDVESSNPSAHSTIRTSTRRGEACRAEVHTADQLRQLLRTVKRKRAELEADDLADAFHAVSCQARATTSWEDAQLSDLDREVIDDHC